MLNLQSGQYHGLNPVAAAMLEAVSAGTAPATAASALAERFEQPVERVEADLLELLGSLAERGLVDVAGSP